MNGWAQGSRFLIFSAVGGIGLIAQLGCLWVFRDGLGWSYLAAAAVAIEVAILQNFVWHARWTWSDRTVARTALPLRLVQYNVAHAGTALLNIVLMWALIRFTGIHYLIATLVSVAGCSAVNFAVSDRGVFRITDEGRLIERLPAR